MKLVLLLECQSSKYSSRQTDWGLAFGIRVHVQTTLDEKRKSSLTGPRCALASSVSQEERHAVRDGTCVQRGGEMVTGDGDNSCDTVVLYLSWFKMQWIYISLLFPLPHALSCPPHASSLL